MIPGGFVDEPLRATAGDKLERSIQATRETCRIFMLYAFPGALLWVFNVYIYKTILSTQQLYYCHLHLMSEETEVQQLK